MSSKLTPTALPTPPKEYDIGYMDRLVKQIALEFTKSRAVTPFTCGSDLSGEAGFPISGLTIVNPPISSTGSPPDGFPEGSVWCDTTSENSLKIITSGPYTDQDSLNLANTTDPALGDALVGFRQSNASGNLTGAVGRTVHEKLQETVSVKDFGAVGNGVANDTDAIQSAITAVSALGGGTIYFPAGTYNIQSAITFRSNLAFKGDGRSSIIKAKIGSFYMFNADTYDADNVTFDGLNFDGSDNYPTNTITTNPRTYADRNVAIRVGNRSANNLRVVNCYFYRLSGGAIDVLRDGVSNIVIQNNELRDANYCQWAICIRNSTNPPTASTRPTQILIDGNTIYGGGPQSWYDPSVESWASSTDAIAIDNSQNFVVSNNVIQRNSGIGIRVEQSIWGVISNNEIYNAGQNGIVCYKKSYYVSITGNVIKSWGRIPVAYAIRSYSGSYIYAKEFPSAAYAPLPANPTLSSWFATWPFDLTNVDTTKIIAYSDTDYYTTGPNGILPFRGYAAISVNFESAYCVVSGNTCIGDTTQVGGKYLYASDFGYSNVHPVNNDNIADTGKNTQVIGNYFGDVRQYGTYAPIYQDPINAQGVMGVGQYNGNFDTPASISIFNGDGRFSNLYLTPDMLITSGSAAPTTGSYARGSIVYNTAPSAGLTPGWVCVTAGTPGTWMPFGQTGVVTSVAATPSYVGQIAVVAGVGYLATGVASSADWTQIT